MTKKDLIILLEEEIQIPQHSERWVMYRLINPIIDFCCQGNEWIPYFEHPDKHAKNIDIVLLKKSDKAYIEAKALSEKINPLHVLKYSLNDGMIGLVSNGFRWLVVLKGEPDKYLYLNLFNEQKKIDAISLDTLISVLKCSETSELHALHWSEERKTLASCPFAPGKPSYEKATKNYFPKTSFSNSKEAVMHIARLKNVSSLIQAFLVNFLQHLQNHDKNIHFEINEKRFVWFNDNEPSTSKRIGRVILTGKMPQILVKTSIVDSNEILNRIAQCQIHDKTEAFRHFIIRDLETASKFGEELGKITKHL